ncbi:MAG: tyrosine-type recombinase/integrase [Chloroflexota bacterium]
MPESRQQLPLFSNDPQTQDDITRRTALDATFSLFAEYLRREGKSQNTITAFLSDLRLVGQYLGTDRTVGSIVTSDLERFLHWLEFDRGVPCSRKSYARRVTSLKVYFKWLKGLKVVAIDPAEAVLQRSGPAPLSNVLSMDQIRAVTVAAHDFRKGEEQDYRPEMLFRLLVDTGIKKGEMARLRPADIDRLNPNAPVMTIRHKSRNVYKERRIDLDPEWLKLYDLYMAQYHPVKDRKTGKPVETVITCTERNMEYILNDLGEAAGIPFKLSFEVLRWTCAVRDYRLGMEDQALREKLGLSEPSWHETSNKIRQLAEKLASSKR